MPTPEHFLNLRRAPVLSGLSEEHLRGLLKHMKRRSLVPGESLFQQDWKGDYMAVVADGDFQVSVRGTDGRETPVSELHAGDVVGEMACVDPSPRCATVTARRPATVFCLSRPMLLALRDKGPGVAMAILSGVIAQVTDRIRQTNGQLEDRIQAGSPRSAQPRVRDIAAATRAALGPASERAPRLHRDPLDLSRIRDLGDMTPADLEVLATVSRCLRFEAGALLCAEGEAGDSCYVVVEGEVDVIKLIGGRPRVLASLDRCLLGQMSLVDPGPRSASLLAATPVVVLELGRDTFSLLLGEHSPFAMRFQDTLAVTGIRQLREANARIASIPAKKGMFKADRAAGPMDGAPPAPRPIPAPAPSTRVTPRLKKRRTPPGGHPLPRALDASSEGEALSMTLAYMQASLKEWGMSMDELDGVSVRRCDGVMSASEKRSRMRGDF